MCGFVAHNLENHEMMEMFRGDKLIIMQWHVPKALRENYGKLSAERELLSQLKREALTVSIYFINNFTIDLYSVL